VKAVCKAEKTCRSRKTNRATNRIVCPQYRHQRCHSGAKATEATVGLQSSSTVECRLKAFVRRQCRRSVAVCKAEDIKQKTDQQSDQQNPPQYRHQRCHSGRRQRRRRYFRSSSTVECRLKAFVRRQCRRMKAGKRKTCKAEDRTNSDQQNRLPSVSTPTPLSPEPKATETQWIQSSSTVECRLKAFVRRQCRR
jgi:hypothetical protein